MGIKKSVMISDQTLNFIEERTNCEIAWSKAVNGAFSNLQLLINLNMPNLSDKDWRIVLDVHSGNINLFDSVSYPFRLASNVMDHYGVIDLNDLVPEIQMTVKKLHGLTQAEQYAVYDVVGRFWAKNWSEVDGEFSDILESLTKNSA